MDINISGLDDFQNMINDLEQKAKAFDGTHEIPASELFDISFMQSHTQFSSLRSLLEAGGFKAETSEELAAIPTKELDELIARTTQFSSWKDMLGEAAAEWARKQLGF